jgi:helicase
MSGKSNPDDHRPTFQGLFIGVNKYQSKLINKLASAVRDAEALHALFCDNLGGRAKLLTDSEATTESVRTELQELHAISHPDDVVVIAFSGRGSPTHELITFDADPEDTTNSALPLGEFTELVSAIPARHLLVILDCCFSGGAGAKVLDVPRQPRGSKEGAPLSTEAFLQAMAGTGRVILTASTADQEAWEDMRLGHGYLTYFLIEALLGPGEVADNGKINLLDLLKYVTTKVKASASGSYGARQEPTLRGRWDGEVIWPVFVRGSRYDALFPAAKAVPVNSDIRSLASHGLPESLLDAWAASLPSLNQLQQDAINNGGLFDRQNLLVMAPTSSGKTMIGELAALRATQNGGRSVFLLPSKALVNEQFERFQRSYGPAGVHVVRATGDHNDDVPSILRGQFDLAIFTYKKFSGLVLAQTQLLRMISVIVVDEVQTIVDESRGRELELLLTLIKSRRDEGIEPQLVALSAVLGEINGLDSWLDAKVLQSDKRPVPLDEGVLDISGQYHYLDPAGTEHVEQLISRPYGEARAQTLLIPLTRQLIAQGQQIIVIRGNRGPARGAARYLARSLGLPPATTALDLLPQGDLTRSAAELQQCLQGGVAFHISDLEAEERRIIEEEFRRSNSSIRVIVATTTLAQGINTPAETVIMPELSRQIGPREVAWYSVADYKNIVGRAGRLGLTERGRAIVLSTGLATANRVWNDYVHGRPEDVESTLLDPHVDLYTIVLRVAAIAAGRSDDGSAALEDLIAILANSLAAHQARLKLNTEAFAREHISDAIAELQRIGFLDVIADNRTKLSALGIIVAQSALSVQSAIRVTSVLRNLRPSDLNPETLITVAQLTDEVDATRLTVNKKGVGKELRTFVSGLHGRRAAGPAVDALGQYGAPPEIHAARAKKAVACLLWIGGVPLRDIETHVMQHYFDRNASGPIGRVVSRTHDVIDTVLAIAETVHPTAELMNVPELLPVQLELGIPTSVASFALAGPDLRREDYLRLHQLGLTTPDAIQQAEETTLLKALADSRDRLRSLQKAVESLRQAETVPSLDELLGEVDNATQ